jgi:hypothetical protein
MQFSMTWQIARDKTILQRKDVGKNIEVDNICKMTFKAYQFEKEMPKTCASYGFEGSKSVIMCKIRRPTYRWQEKLHVKFRNVEPSAIVRWRYFLYRYNHTVFSHVCAVPLALTIWRYDIDVSTAILS